MFKKLIALLERAVIAYEERITIQRKETEAFVKRAESEIKHHNLHYKKEAAIVESRIANETKQVALNADSLNHQKQRCKLEDERYGRYRPYTEALKEVTKEGK